ncbi:UDP-D-xylose:L-fucose alpha-1,3-D-xylosyltransferase MGP4-like [Patiria miniata]|uniref:Nucleotide-diphospho-sugar transferase domain-containing protein n=1 Tax=Patiria miniata TaxID=46514 RepID=A0A913Z1K2_PATMI|nr:UDP-D-xylose:L-fucose alpha-1,3-D-xylosyltransferase MGP4-like [Patiria miniata]
MAGLVPMATVMATRKVNAWCFVCSLLLLILAASLLMKCSQTNKNIYPNANSKEQTRVTNAVKSSNRVDDASAKIPARLCTQVDIDRHAGTVLLTTTNAGFLDMTENMLHSIKRLRICPNITVIAEDERSYRRLSALKTLHPGLHVQRTNLGATTSDRLRVYGRTYVQFVKRRTHYILRFLEDGYNVLFADADTFWFQDPFPDFRGNFDIAMRQEVNPASLSPVFCNGLALYRPTENTLAVVREWVRLLNTTHKKTMDKDVLNRVIQKRKPNLRMKSLDPGRYPDGRVLRDKGWVKKQAGRSAVLHFSHIFGYEGKLKKFKENGLWLL